MNSYNTRGRVFKKSSFSPNIKTIRCVGVSMSDTEVLITNIGKNTPVLQFNIEEWDAFVRGVKNNEFDLEKRI